MLVGRQRKIAPRRTILPILPNPRRDSPMLWLIVLILIILAIAGGLALSKFLFALLIVAIIVALLARRSVA